MAPVSRRTRLKANKTRPAFTSLPRLVRHKIYEMVFDEPHIRLSCQAPDYRPSFFIPQIANLPNYALLTNKASNAAIAKEARRFFFETLVVTTNQQANYECEEGFLHDYGLHPYYYIRPLIKTLYLKWDKGLWITQSWLFQGLRKLLESCANVEALVIDIQPSTLWRQCWLSHTLRTLHEKLKAPLVKRLELEISIAVEYLDCMDGSRKLFEYQGTWSQTWKHTVHRLNLRDHGMDKEGSCPCAIGSTSIEEMLTTGLIDLCKSRYWMRSLSAMVILADIKQIAALSGKHFAMPSSAYQERATTMIQKQN